MADNSEHNSLRREIHEKRRRVISEKISSIFNQTGSMNFSQYRFRILMNYQNISIQAKITLWVRLSKSIEHSNSFKAYS